MQRILKFTFLLFLFSATAQAQQLPYGHEWIQFNSNTPTLKIKVLNTGIYRVDYAALEPVLQAASYPVSQLDPRDIVIYNKGKIVPVYISGEGDGSFDPGDYIEFFGEKNDAWFDQFLYEKAMYHPNPWFSNFSDTAIYFLSIRSNASLPGKRLQSVANNVSNPGPKRQYFINEQIFSYHSEWNGGHASNQGGVFLYSPEYTNGEGFVDNNFNKTSISKTLNLDGIFKTGSVKKARIKVNLVSYYDQTHRIRMDVNGNVLLDTSYFGQGVRPLEAELSLGKLNAGAANTLGLQALGTGSSDRNAIAYIQVSYPSDFDFNQKNFYRFHLVGPKNKTVYFEVNNFDAGGSQPILYDLANAERLIGQSSGNIIRFNLPFPSADTADLVLSSESNILTPAGISIARFHSLSKLEEQGNYILIYHRKLTDDGSGNNLVDIYSQYRSSTQGGGYRVVTLDINTIYDQFGYGIDRHPQAIRNFVRFMLDSFKVLPEYILLAGKGVEYPITRFAKNENYRKLDLIPPFGSPGGDMLYTVNKNKQPMIAIGRLSVRNGSNLLVYFEKLKALEENQNQVSNYSLEEKNWTKNVMHFGGGSDNAQQNLFKSFLAGYQRKIENPYFGGRVYNFYKSSSDPIQYVQSQFLDSVISSGVSLITFFGHSSTNSFDINLDKPENYKNFGKTPIIISNGCFSGQIFSAGYGVSEEFVLQPGGGAIGFLASTSYGEQFSLNQYSDKLYENLSKFRYNDGFGKSILHTVRYILDSTNPNIFSYYLVFQSTFHGDPALRINTHEKPDYAIEPSYVHFEPENISVDLDSFAVAVIVHNVGRAINDSFVVEVRRTFSDGSFDLQSKKVKAAYSDDTVRLFFYTDPIRGINRNDFEVILDAGNRIDEMREDNNRTEVAIDIHSVDAFPLTPYPYSIAHGSITLKANTADFSSQEREYRMEIDTTALFDSPVKSSTLVKASGGVFEWSDPPIDFRDEVVYYWRVRPVINGSDSGSWKMSSFVYSDQNIHGWNQSHYYQFLDNRFENVEFRGRKLSFIDDVKELRITNGIYSNVRWEDVTAYYINGSRVNRFGCAGNGISFGVIDPATGIPWKPADHPFGQESCYWVTQRGAFHFPTYNIAQRERVIRFIDSIPDGFYFFAMSFQKPDFKLWKADTQILGTSIFNKLLEQGASPELLDLDNRSYSPAFIFFTRKGAPGNAATLITKNQGELLDTTFIIKGKWNQGYISSQDIGPVSGYGSLSWETAINNDPVAIDETQMTFTGVDPDLRTEKKIFTTERKDTSLQMVDASVYPYARLRYYLLDDSFRTALGLRKWRILYDPVGDLAVNPNRLFYLSADSIEQGEKLEMRLAVENISEFDMDSVLIALWHVDTRNQKSLVWLKRFRALPAGDTLIIQYSRNTLSDDGRNTLLLEVNPGNDQPEQYSFNNRMNIPYTVIRDKRNPLLDVTFDGIHIMDNDIVSSRPEIRVVLMDDNRFLPLNDTALINLFLLAPDGTRKRLPFAQPDITFIPAAEDPEGKNEAEIIYMPEFSEDGRYELIVSASDKAGNRAGDLDYRIGFRVITESSISNVFNYPNPFSSSTRFVFTITGAEVPRELRIQIMTITGRVVREITKDELGPLHVGTNITEFAWDGSDKYGDPLANGLYLYRIISKDADGKSMKNFELPSNADRFFKNGIGKLYLAR